MSPLFFSRKTIWVTFGIYTLIVLVRIIKAQLSLPKIGLFKLLSKSKDALCLKRVRGALLCVYYRFFKWNFLRHAWTWKILASKLIAECVAKASSYECHKNSPWTWWSRSFKRNTITSKEHFPSSKNSHEQLYTEIRFGLVRFWTISLNIFPQKCSRSFTSVGHPGIYAFSFKNITNIVFGSAFQWMKICCSKFSR